MGTKKLYFEKANNTMTQEIVEVVFSALKEYQIIPEPKGADQELFSVEESYFKQAGHFEVLRDPELNHKIVATWGVLPTSFEACELRKMYMDEKYRGLGYGRQMVERCLAWARENQFKYVDLETTASLVEAIKLYEKMGFEKVMGAHNAIARCELVYRLKL